jgi:hypothetical protein
MHPTTTGRYRVHDRRENPTDVDASTAVFVLVKLPPAPIDPTDADAGDAYDPVYVVATGYEDALADRVASLEAGAVVDATLTWDDGTARFRELSVQRETRFWFADDVEGMFEAAVETWQRIRADGEAVGSITTRSTDDEPNGALYVFADGLGTDTFEEVRTGRLPIEPLVARVNQTREDDVPRSVFVLRPAAYDFVAVYVVFDRDGVLAQTVRDTYDLGDGLVDRLTDTASVRADGKDDAFDLTDRL